MEITTATVGFCLGITRAYRLMNARALTDAPFYVTHQNFGGELDTLRRIERRDAHLLSLYPALEKIAVVHDASELRQGDRLVLGFHGLPREVKEGLTANGVVLVDDLQCPFITRLNGVLERLVREGFDVIIVGSKGNHHCQEAQRLAEEYGRTCVVIERPEDIESMPNDDAKRWALVGQVTGNTTTFKDVVRGLREKGIPAKIVRTICSDSYLRQGIAMNFAKEADLVIVVDDGGGAAQSVVEVCSQLRKNVHRIGSKDEVKRECLEGVRKVAIVGGILVPQWSLDEVARHIKQICDERGREHVGIGSKNSTGA